jgi:tetratricopeptide (TPR) repeat protein
MPPQLFEFTFSHEGTLLARFELGPGEYVVGRDEACEIAIDIEGIALAHARLIVGEEVFVEDQGTAEGTFADGRRLSAAEQVRPGCRVVFGSCAGILELQPLVAGTPLGVVELEPAVIGTPAPVAQSEPHVAENAVFVDEARPLVCDMPAPPASRESLVSEALPPDTEPEPLVSFPEPAAAEAEPVPAANASPPAQAGSLLLALQPALPEAEPFRPDTPPRATEPESHGAAALDAPIAAPGPRFPEAVPVLPQPRPLGTPVLPAPGPDPPATNGRSKHRREKRRNGTAVSSTGGEVSRESSRAAAIDEGAKNGHATIHQPGADSRVPAQDPLPAVRAELEALAVEHRRVVAELVRERESWQARENELREQCAALTDSAASARGLHGPAQEELAAARRDLEAASGQHREALDELARERNAWAARENELRERCDTLFQAAGAVHVAEHAAKAEIDALKVDLEARRDLHLQDLARGEENHRTELTRLQHELEELSLQRDQLASEREQLAGERDRLARTAEPPGSVALRKAKEHSNLMTEANKVLLQKLAATGETTRELEQVRKELKQREHALLEALVRRQAAEEQCLQISRQMARLEEGLDQPAPPPAERPGAGQRRLVLCGIALAIVAGLIAFAMSAKSSAGRARAAEGVVAQLDSIVPQLHAQTLELMQQRRFEEATRQINFALALRPKAAEYQLLRGYIAQARLRLEEAVAAFETSLDLNPNQPAARANLELCRSILKTRGGVATLESRYALHRLMMDQLRWPEALELARYLDKDRALVHRTWLAVLAAAGLGNRLVLNEDGTFDLDLSRTGRPDLAVIKELPLRALNLSLTTVTDLSPLSGMPIRILNLSGVPIRDLQPLAGLPLEKLDLSDSEASNLFPLAGMPLKELSLDRTQVSDLTALRGSIWRILGWWISPRSNTCRSTNSISTTRA